MFCMVEVRANHPAIRLNGPRDRWRSVRISAHFVTGGAALELGAAFGCAPPVIEEHLSFEIGPIIFESRAQPLLLRGHKLIHVRLQIGSPTPREVGVMRRQAAKESTHVFRPPMRQ